MGFQIGSQNASTINNVEGTQYNVSGSAGGDPRQLVEQLRAELDRLALPRDVKADAEAQVRAVDAALSKPEPDKPAMAERLSRLATILTSAGAVVAAGTGLGAPLAALAGWLGALGEPIGRFVRR